MSHLNRLMNHSDNPLNDLHKLIRQNRVNEQEFATIIQYLTLFGRI